MMHGMQQAAGNHRISRMLSETIQPKLTVSTPGDAHEREAEEMANRVMRMPSNPESAVRPTHSAQPQVQRACACGGKGHCPECAKKRETVQGAVDGHAPSSIPQRPSHRAKPQVQRACACGGQGQCPECAKKKETVQRKAEEQAPSMTADTEARIHRLRSGGQPMSPAVRREFEPRFGQDFGGVRIHTSPEAAQVSREINARAFTIGRDVMFGAGQYAPETMEGQKLLAHELTHVVQQGGSREQIHRDGVPTGTALILNVLFKGVNIGYEIDLDSETMAFFANETTHRQIETLIASLFTPASGPVLETPEFLSGGRVKALIAQDLRDSAKSGQVSLPGLSDFLQERKRILSEQKLLAGVCQWLQTSGGPDPATVDWNDVIPVLQARLPWTPKTALEASNFDRYGMFLTMLGSEAASLSPVSGKVAPDPAALEHTLYDYLINHLPLTAFTDGTITIHSEKFLADWIPAIEHIRYLPDNFDIKSFQPKDSEQQLAQERNRILGSFIEQDVPRLATMFILDEWTRSGQAPEQWLKTLNVDAYREQILDHLSDEFITRAQKDERLQKALRVSAIEKARFQTLSLIYGIAAGRDKSNASAKQRLGNTPIDKLDDNDRAIANDPAGYAKVALLTALPIYTFFASLTPGQPIEEQLIIAAKATLDALHVPDQLAGLVLLVELTAYFASLQSLQQDEKNRAREIIRKAIDLDLPKIEKVIRRQAELAEIFIQKRWLPMLKVIALEKLKQNRDELQKIYDNFDSGTQLFIARMEEGASTFDYYASGLETGLYESIEMNDKVVSKADVAQLRTAAQFMRDEAARRKDPKRGAEMKKQLQEALSVYESVKKDLAADKFDPLEYSSPVYDEARQRLGIGEFPEFTTVGQALTGEVSADKNPFLARVIVGWKFKTGLEHQFNTGLLLLGLGALTVAAMLAGGIPGLVLKAVDITVGIGMGVKGVADANTLLDMARLDTSGSIRGVSIEQAQQAVKYAWIGLGITIAMTAGPTVLKGALRVTGAGGLKLSGALLAWEEGLTDATRLTLAQNSRLRRLFVDMSELSRWLLTHCSLLCVPPGLVAHDVEKIESIVGRLKDMKEADHWLLREYFYSRQADIGAAIAEIEKGSVNLSKLRKTLREAASARALKVPSTLPDATSAPGQGFPGQWGDPSSRSYGHSVSEHGAQREGYRLADRARKQPAGIGQWYDNQFIVEAERRATPATVVKTLPNGTEHVVEMGRPVGRVFMQDGTIISDVTNARVIRHADGSLETSFPIR
jgi:hypothetical protein